MSRTTLALSLCLAACGPSLHVVPVANPITAATDPVELRVPNPDGDTQHWCTYSRATDCLDDFWHLEAMGPDFVVVRWRRVGSDREEIRATEAFVSHLELFTSDGARVHGTLDARFDVAELPPIRYEQEVAIASDRVRYRAQADGSVVAQREYDYGTEERSSVRYSGSNYIVFRAPGLVTPRTTWVELHQPGALGIQQQWRWAFDGERAQNVRLARSPELDRPDLARTGPVHRK